MDVPDVVGLENGRFYVVCKIPQHGFVGIWANCDCKPGRFLCPLGIAESLEGSLPVIGRLPIRQKNQNGAIGSRRDAILVL